MNQIIIVIDASNAAIGRVASYAAKQALLGKKVIIVNCSAAILTGRKESIINEYRELKSKGGSILKGPFFPKKIEKIMKRTVRGMLNYHQQRGADALKRILCCKNIPKEYEGFSKVSFSKKGSPVSITLSNLSKEI